MPDTAELQLRSEMAEAVKEMRKISDKYKDASGWSNEDQAKFDELHTAYETKKQRADELKKQADRQKIVTDAEDYLSQRRDNTPPPGRADFTPNKGTDGAATAPTEQHRALALQAWMRRQTGRPLTQEQKDAAQLCRVNTRSNEIGLALGGDYGQVRHQYRMAAHQKRAQSINIQTAGAYTIPQGFVPEVEIALLAYANVREWADVMRTESGNDLPWPTTNDTTNKATLIAENTTVSEQDVTFGQVVFHAFKYTSGLIQVPAELMEDSAINLAQLIGQLMGIRFGRIQADHFTTGTGAGQPTGYLTAATLGVTTASSTAIAADELYDLKHSVDPWYRPGAIWTLHDLVLKYIKKLKDGLGRYLWQSSLAGGAPDTIDGDPVMVNQSMSSSIATTNTTVAYGQMSKYKIRDVAQIRMRRLVERYADQDQEAFVGFLRCDANLIDAGTHPIKYLKQA